MRPLTPALTLHLLTELPASLSFLLAPTAQLPSASPDARLILRNFGGLLMATNLLCVVLLFHHQNPTATIRGGCDDDDRLIALLCGCLGTYHLWPCYRAYARLKGGKGSGMRGEKAVLGGPAVHLVVHVVCLGAMVGGAGWVLIRG
ncbi:hypothetical protein C8A05DRAFT_19153 [Staphylotrichum tortipilum]|uniref:Uncharacterized protein n=1 Tax=Staphylotrichum tortipilum TaxID=2831512 RepID=A0AAN6MCH0_9PEZI|nr:hypothetical protein C8A05DRAFT_19153 [Staphylotrichum longicolle]